MSTPAQMIQAVREVDLSSHEGMATEPLALLEQANLQIPIPKARDMVELLDWLEAIKSGELKMSEVTKQ